MAVYMYMKTGLINDTEEGPHKLDEMAKLLSERVINPSTLCTRSGDSAWRTVGDYTEISARVAELQQHAATVAQKQHEQQQLLEQQQLAAEQQQAMERQRVAAQQAAAQQAAAQQAAPAAHQVGQAAQTPFQDASGPIVANKRSVAARPRRRKTVLFDIFFTRFVTPTAVTALWILSIIGYIGGFLFLLISASVGSLALVASSDENGAAAGGFAFLLMILYLIGYLLVGGLYLLIYRILLECIMVIFRCSQSLDLIAGREPPFEV